MKVDEIDFDGRFTVRGYEGIAFWLWGWEQTWEPVRFLMSDDDGNEWEEEDPGEGEWIDDPDRRNVIAVMVGDDRKHTVSIDDLIPLAEDDYCPECGQVGCTAYAR